jgi:hypothetical protein
MRMTEVGGWMLLWLMEVRVRVLMSGSVVDMRCKVLRGWHGDLFRHWMTGIRGRVQFRIDCIGRGNFIDRLTYGFLTYGALDRFTPIQSGPRIHGIG